MCFLRLLFTHIICLGLKLCPELKRLLFDGDFCPEFMFLGLLLCPELKRLLFDGDFCPEFMFLGLLLVPRKQVTYISNMHYHITRNKHQ